MTANKITAQKTSAVLQLYMYGTTFISHLIVRTSGCNVTVLHSKKIYMHYWMHSPDI